MYVLDETILFLRNETKMSITLKPYEGKLKWFRCSKKKKKKKSACNVGDLGSILGLGKSPEEGKGNPI